MLGRPGDCPEPTPVSPQGEGRRRRGPMLRALDVTNREGPEMLGHPKAAREANCGSSRGAHLDGGATRSPLRSSELPLD